MSRADLFWTPEPDSAEIRAAIRSYDGRWRDALTQTTHTSQTSAGGALMLVAFIIGGAVLAAVLPLGEAAASVADQVPQIGSSAALAALGVLAPLLITGAVLRGNATSGWARSVQSAALLLGLALLAATGMSMIWATFGRGAFALLLMALYAAALVAGSISVLKGWKARLVSTLAAVPLTTTTVAGSSVLALAASALAFVVFKQLFAASPEMTNSIISALICSVACYIIAWLVSMGSINAARLFISLGLLR
jgi:hypothetical protein